MHTAQTIRCCQWKCKCVHACCVEITVGAHTPGTKCICPGQEQPYNRSNRAREIHHNIATCIYIPIICIRSHSCKLAPNMEIQHAAHNITLTHQCILTKGTELRASMMLHSRLASLEDGGNSLYFNLA